MGQRRAPAIGLALGLACLAALCLTGPACAQSSIVAVEGNRRVDAETIRSHLHASDDGTFHSADISAALKGLYATRLFKDVQISRRNTGLLVKVTENPVIARIAYEGNKAIKDEQFAPLVQSKPQGPLSPALVHDDVERIVDLYHHSGRFDVKVEPKMIENKDHGVNLVFEIKEGKKTGVAQINFAGNGAFSSNKLRGVIKTGRTNVLSFLVNNDLYDPDQIEADRGLLGRFYRDRGYPDARVVSAIVRYEPAAKGVVLTFTIDEGAPYKFGAVAVKSNVPAVDGEKLKRLLKTREGDTYNIGAIDGAIEAMLMDLARDGEPFLTVKANGERVPDRHVINLTYTISAGPRVYVERIEINGNGKTRDSVIRRELTFSEGSAYNRAQLDASERHLKKLGFFKTVKFRQKPGSAPDRVIVAVDIEEQETGAFTISGGYSDQYGLLADVAVGDRNLLGTGVSGRVAVEYGQYTRGFDVSLSQPFVAGRRIALGFDVFAKQIDSSSYQSWSSMAYGGAVTAGTPITDDLGLVWRYSLTNQSLAIDPTLGAASIPVQQAAAAGPMWVSMAGATVRYSTVDNDRSPTSGMRATINNDVAGLGGDVKFLRNTDDVKFYQPITNEITGMVRAQTGAITPWGGQSLPLLNGFFGGPQLVRGFAPNGFGPRDITPGTTKDNLGGNVYWATSAEMQSEIPMLPPELKLKASLFADAGSVWNTGVSNFPALSQSLQVDNSRAVRSSIGAGLVWDSMFGPLRMDYGFPISKGAYDVTQRLHFGYGAF